MVTESIEEMASRWIARLDREDASDHDRAAFERWRGADPRHAAAYARLDDIWNRLLRLHAARANPQGGGAIGPAAPAVPVPRVSRVTEHLRAVLAACLAVVIIGLMTWSQYESADTSRRFVTEIGDYRRVPLVDGTIVELNTDTELRTSMTAASRRVELLKGEATFKVASDPGRPFVVVAGTTALQALGTMFNVRRRDGIVEVLMVEGTVAVGTSEEAQRSEQPGAPPVPVIHAGQAAIVAAHAELEVRAVNRDEVERELAWRKGMLSFKDSTLIDAAAEFNRYNSRQIIVSDPRIADVRVGGYFRANNIDGFVRVLESEFDISATRERERIELAAGQTSQPRPRPD
jgi:transmembrane sensor